MSPDQPAGPPQDPRPRYPRYPGEHQPDPADWPGAASPALTWPSTGEHQEVTASAAVPDRPAGWWIRVLAAVIDSFVVVGITIVPFVVGLVIAFDGATFDEVTGEVSDVDGRGLVVIGATSVLWGLVDAWNRGLRVGYKGQSLGKQAVGVHVVRADGRPTGALEGFFRWLLSLLLQWTIVGLLVDLLWPLWDERRQTVHDKAIGTYPVRR